MGDVVGKGRAVAGRYTTLWKASPLWADADYVLGNLECTLIDESAYGGPGGEHFRCSTKPFRFGRRRPPSCKPPNHTVDWVAGLLHTRVLKGNSIDAVEPARTWRRAGRRALLRLLTVKTFAASDIVPEHRCRERSANALDGGGVCRAVADARTAPISLGAPWGLDRGISRQSGRGWRDR
ncbi:MAG: hypothetical protein ACLTEX_06635 [Eggerthella lenta]